jgi:hypothetical protein
MCEQIETIQARLSQRKRPTLQHTAWLLQEIDELSTLLDLTLAELNEVEHERNTYAALARLRRSMSQAIATATQHASPVAAGSAAAEVADTPAAHTARAYTDGWNYNVREFFEAHIQGWRAIVSSDSEEHEWIAYVEHGGTRIYANQPFALLQEAFDWCKAEINRQF